MTRFFQPGVFLVSFSMSFPATLAFATETQLVQLAMSFESAASMSDALAMGASDPATGLPVYSIGAGDPTIVPVPETEVPGASPTSSGASK